MNRRTWMIIILAFIEGLVFSSWIPSFPTFLAVIILISIPNVIFIRWLERMIWGYNE